MLCEGVLCRFLQGNVKRQIDVAAGTRRRFVKRPDNAAGHVGFHDPLAVDAAQIGLKRPFRAAATHDGVHRIALYGKVLVILSQYQTGAPQNVCRIGRFILPRR